MQSKALYYGQGPFFDHLCNAMDLPGEPDLIRNNTNLIYDCGEFILRLTPNAFRSREEVERELHWLRFVGSQTEDVVQVYDDHSAHAQQIDFDDEHFTATVLEKIIGEPVNEAQWNEPHFERIGQLTGFLHRIGEAYVAPSGRELTEWDHVPENCLSTHLPDDQRQLPQLSTQAFDYMTAMKRHDQSYGPIHYDIHAGNYLITADDRLVLFDFENSCRGHHINDIAVALYYAMLHQLTTEPDGFDETFMPAFWIGYQREREIPEREIEHIPWLLLNRALIVYGYLFKIWPDEQDETQQAFVQRVEDGIERLRAVLNI